MSKNTASRMYSVYIANPKIGNDFSKLKKIALASHQSEDQCLSFTIKIFGFRLPFIIQLNQEK